MWDGSSSNWTINGYAYPEGTFQCDSKVPTFLSVGAKMNQSLMAQKCPHFATDITQLTKKNESSPKSHHFKKQRKKLVCYRNEISLFATNQDNC